MTERDDDTFRLHPAPPRDHGTVCAPRFISRVLKASSKAGRSLGRALLPPNARAGARLGRGHVAARFAGSSLGPRARRVVIKTRLVMLKHAGPRSTQKHLRYIERDGVTREGGRGQLYGSQTAHADGGAFEQRSLDDRHQFRFIVSPEDAIEVGDLKTYTRSYMARMEQDLGTRLDWVAVDHWDTDNPHTHIVLRGKDDRGHDLVIARDYISHGMRQRASELATQWLGPRTEREIEAGLTRDVSLDRWTGLDRTLQREAHDGCIDLRGVPPGTQGRAQRARLLGRLDHLAKLGLAQKEAPGVWTLAPQAEQALRALGERGDIIRTIQRALGNQPRDYQVFDVSRETSPVTGRIAAKGLADELHDRGYLIVDGVDGLAHYVALPRTMELADYPVGSIVDVHAATAHAADRTIAAVAEDGVYRSERHLELVRAHQRPAQDPETFVQAHVRRLEALRRTGIVERFEDDVWRIPADLAARGRVLDAARTDGVVVTLHSHLSIERQVRAIGATWLDRQLIEGAAGLAMQGFGADARSALRRREAFLVEQGLAQRRGTHVVLAHHLLPTLRNREIDNVAQAIASKNGLVHRAMVDGQRISGRYRRSLQLVTGRFALLEDGAGFSLVPWRPIIERHLGQPVSAVVRGSHVSWEFGRKRELSR